MDRRQRKTREAIFGAFTELLNKKSFPEITVAEIIELADVGRATFYAHFETKDYLLKELCHELFCHIFDASGQGASEHKHIFKCDAPDSVFLHLFMHLKHNDNHILDLLSGRNNELFLLYFKQGIIKLAESQISLFINEKTALLPKEYLVEHIASTFVGTINWWVKNKMIASPEKVNEYFLISLGAK